MEIGIGSVVFSKAGRDKQMAFIVLSLSGEFAFVADGDLRKADKPKKKKLKHLQATSYKSEFIENKVLTQVKVTNAELRKALSEHRPI